jgi:hypothetical protein
MRGIRGKTVKTVKEGTLIATVDIGMTSNTGYCTTVDGRDIKPLRFENTTEGFEKFLHMIVASKNKFVAPRSWSATNRPVPMQYHPHQVLNMNSPREHRRLLAK